METTWKILNLKRKPNTGLVIEVTYVMNFDLNGEKDRNIGMIELVGDENDPNFVLFEELTEEIVLNWVKGDLGEEKIQEIENRFQLNLEERIERKANPEFLQGLPWKENGFFN